MTDILTAKRELAGHTLCLCKDGRCLYSDKRGIAPLMEFMQEGVDLRGFSAADVVVGAAAAWLMVKAGIREVFARTLSQSGQRILTAHGIAHTYETLAPHIIDRTGTDICPMEKAVTNARDAEEAYAVLQKAKQK